MPKRAEGGEGRSVVFPNGRVNACGARAKRERERKPFFGERDAQSVCLPLLLLPFCRLGTIRNTCSFSGGGLWAGVGCGVYVYVVVVAVFFPSSHRAKHSFLLLFLPPALKLFFAQ